MENLELIKDLPLVEELFPGIEELQYTPGILVITKKFELLRDLADCPLDTILDLIESHFGIDCFYFGKALDILIAVSDIEIPSFSHFEVYHQNEQHVGLVATLIDKLPLDPSCVG